MLLVDILDAVLQDWTVCCENKYVLWEHSAGLFSLTLTYHLC